MSALLPVLLAAALAAPAPADAPPNIVVVMTDDQGWGDLGVHGNPLIRTPHIDALAAAGARIERFYVNPVCSATRASLLTGRWAYRTRVVDTYRGRSMMEPAEVTLAEVLQAAGYRTGIFGKWHLGDCYPLRPTDQGFDEALVHRGGGLAQPSEPTANAGRYTDPILFHNGAPVETEGYCTDVYFDAALEFVEACAAAEDPFFLYLPTNAPHGPLDDVPPEYERYRELDLGPVLSGNDAAADRVARIYAMIENVDQNVGRLLEHLEERGLAADTLVVFLCDNGPAGERFVGPLRGSKSGVHEGGIRSPFFVRWPGQIEPGRRVPQIAAHVDLLPTLCEVAGVALPPGLALDGRSLWPLLAGRAVEWPERLLFIQSHRGDVPARDHHFAVIGPRWKLLRASGFGREEPPPDAPLELYDIAADPGERENRAADDPAVVARLQAAYRAWFADVAATRPDNWAPPRIVIGTASERVTTLTKQDWRSGGPGWGQDGVWKLAAPVPGDFEVTLLFQEEHTIESATLQIGDERREVPVVATGASISLGPWAFPAGDVDFGVDCVVDGERRAPHQVVLAALGRPR